MARLTTGEDLPIRWRHSNHEIVVFDVGILQFFERNSLRVSRPEVGAVTAVEVEVLCAGCGGEHDEDRARNNPPAI